MQGGKKGKNALSLLLRVVGESAWSSAEGPARILQQQDAQTPTTAQSTCVVSVTIYSCMGHGNSSPQLQLDHVTEETRTDSNSRDY